MARRTCKLLVRAFDWGAPLLRKLRASEASFFFCHVQAAPCARLTMEPFFLSNFSSLRRVLVSFRGRTQLFRTGTHTHTFNIYIRVGIRIVLKAVRRIQLYYSWRWPYALEDMTMEEGDDGGAVTHCGATRALARNHTHYQRRRPRFRFRFRFSLICIWAVGKETFLCSEICVLQPLGVAALAAEPP